MPLANISISDGHVTGFLEVQQKRVAVVEPAEIENTRPLINPVHKMPGNYVATMEVTFRQLIHSATGEEILYSAEMHVQDANAVAEKPITNVNQVDAYTTPFLDIPVSADPGAELDYPELRDKVANIKYGHSVVSGVMEIFSNTGDGESAIKEVLVAPTQDVVQFWG